MIQAIMKIGQWAGERDGTIGSIENFVQNPNEKGNIRKVLTITLSKRHDSFIFKDVAIEEFRQKYLTKYLYRRGSPSGADVTPTSKFAGDMKKTFKNKILRNIQNTTKEGENLGLDSEEQGAVRKIYEALSAAEASITERLVERAGEIEKREGAIITLVFQENGKRKYIGEFELFRKVLKSRAKEKYFKQYGKESLANDQMCSVCRKEQAEVYGFVNTYNFYTVDKPGFVTGGFKQQDAWKNYPVCFDCAGKLELGKKYLNENLRFNFYGFRYLLIPKFFSDSIMEESLEILEDISERRATEMIQAGFDQTYINRLTDAEDEILELISQEKGYVSFDLLFYREKQSAFNILLHVEDILPSRFKKLFELKARLDAIDIFRKEVSKKEGQLVFNFGVLHRIFPRISKTRSFDKHFLELVEKIFSLKPVDYHFLIKAITRKLRSKFVNHKSTKRDCLAGYLLLNYLVGLGILSRGGERMEAKPIEDLKESFCSEDVGISEKIELFFKAHGGFFDNAQKKACFLVGILVQHLLNIQLYHILRGVKLGEFDVTVAGQSDIPQNRTKKMPKVPFMSKLQGLRLSEPLIKRISYEAQNKLEQYRENFYRELETVIAQYMVASGSKWNTTNDEISFYFTMGMNLVDLFKTKKEENSNDRPN